MTLVSLVDLDPPFVLEAPAAPPPPPPAAGPAVGYFVMFDPADPDNRRARGKVTRRDDE